MTYYVRDLRVKKGWSTAELARRSGVAASHINGIENKTKNPTIDVQAGKGSWRTRVRSVFLRLMLESVEPWGMLLSYVLSPFSRKAI